MNFFFKFGNVPIWRSAHKCFQGHAQIMHLLIIIKTPIAPSIHMVSLSSTMIKNKINK